MNALMPSRLGLMLPWLSVRSLTTCSHSTQSSFRYVTLKYARNVANHEQTLSDDIAYIEAQGQGLQVQTANQKLLKKELESLLETCAITSNELEVLRSAPLDDIGGLQEVESSLVTLYKAMVKIYPSRTSADQLKVDVTSDTNQGHGLNPDFNQMRIVQEKKQV